MRPEMMVVLAVVVTVGLFGGFSEAQEYAIKYNQTGNCSASNSNCDWFVGVWSAHFDYAAYSCTGNGVSTPPITPDDLCCTNQYTIPSICISGYREEDGVLFMACYLAETTFNNVSADEPAYHTLSQSIYGPVGSFNGGLTSDGYCYPFRQLTTDGWVGNWNTPNFQTGNLACPEFPNQETNCNAEPGQTNAFVGARRRIPASRNTGYYVTKYFNTKGSCNSDNRNCDWFIGSWDGLVVAQGFSYQYLLGLQDYVFPLTQSDVLCAATPYLVS